MDEDLLEKHQNDPAWAEVIRLYSGLFDTQDEREEFILDLADKDVLLAAECKTSSVEEEEKIESYILMQALDKYNSQKTEKTITTYYLTLLSFNKYTEIIEYIVLDFSTIKRLPKKKGTLKRVMKKIVVSYRKNVFDMFIEILNSNKFDSSNVDISEYFFRSLNYDNINFEKNKEKILYITKKLSTISSQHSLSFLFLLERSTTYLLFEKDFIVSRVKNHFEKDFIVSRVKNHFEKNELFQITILWIKKYEIKNLFSDEYVLSKIIETEYWKMAFDFIENSTSIDVKKTVLEIVDILMAKNKSIDFIINKMIKYNIIDNISRTSLITYSLKHKNHLAFEKLIEIYHITDLEIIKSGIDFFLKSGKSGKFMKYLYLIEKYHLQSFFTIDYIFENIDFVLNTKILEELCNFYSIESLDTYTYSFARESFNQNKLGLAEQIIDFCGLWSEFNFDEFINKAFELKKWGLLTQWYSKYNIQERYTIQNIIHYAIKNQDIHNAYQIAKEFNLDFSDFYTISVGDTVNCTVRKIVMSRVFVKIQNETRSASIYIGELADKRIANIFDFEYNGEKLHIGKKLTAKVISIDEQDRINLSLK